MANRGHHVERLACVVDVILRAVPPREAVSFREIYRAVLDDYGDISSRHLHRYLRGLTDLGVLRRDAAFCCYTRGEVVAPEDVARQLPSLMRL